MTDTNIEKRSISFAAAKSKFSNNGFQVDSSSNESVDSIGKKFKYEVKFPGVIHTTTRKNNVGDGLNELKSTPKPSLVKSPNIMQEARKLNSLERSESVSSLLSSASNNQSVDNISFRGVKHSTPCPKSQNNKVSMAAGDEMEIVKVLKTLSKAERENLGFSSKQSDGKKVQSQSLSDRDTFPELPACAYKPALFPKPSKEKIREALDRVREASNSASVENGVSPDRFKVRPFLCSDIDGYVAPDKRDHNLERCKVTHDSSKLEAKIERKHGFQSDPSIKHVKADTVVCSITKGNDKKDIKPNEQEPLSEVSKVNVKELASKFLS